MASCTECVHVEVCQKTRIMNPAYDRAPNCGDFKDRSRFVELTIARKIKHTPDVEKMREFHKLGLGKGMSERSIFWTCSNCEMWTSLAHKFCPNCGAKFETEQALKEREDNA